MNGKGQNKNNFWIILIVGIVLGFFFYQNFGLFSILVGQNNDEVTVVGCGLNGCKVNDEIRFEINANQVGTGTDGIAEGLVCRESIYGEGFPYKLTTINPNQNNYESVVNGGVCFFLCQVPDEVLAFVDIGTDTYKEHLCATYAIVDGQLYDSTGRLGSQSVTLLSGETPKEVPIYWYHITGTFHQISNSNSQTITIDNDILEIEMYQETTTTQTTTTDTTTTTDFGTGEGTTTTITTTTTTISLDPGECLIIEDNTCVIVTCGTSGETEYDNSSDCTDNLVTTTTLSSTSGGTTSGGGGISSFFKKTTTTIPGQEPVEEKTNFRTIGIVLLLGIIAYIYYTGRKK